MSQSKTDDFAKRSRKASWGTYGRNLISEDGCFASLEVADDAEEFAKALARIVNAADRANTAFFAGHDMVKPMAELNAALTKAGVR